MVGSRTGQNGQNVMQMQLPVKELGPDQETVLTLRQHTGEQIVTVMQKKLALAQVNTPNKTLNKTVTYYQVCFTHLYSI